MEFPSVRVVVEEQCGGDVGWKTVLFRKIELLFGTLPFLTKFSIQAVV